MQTFLPYPEFDRSARCLDTKRLGRQRKEAWQIFAVLTGLRYDDTLRRLVPSTKAVSEHYTVVRQWRGYEWALFQYLEACINEWHRRGYHNGKLSEMVEAVYESEIALGFILRTENNYPSWLGSKEFHNSHRSALLRKAPPYYRSFKWQVASDLPYVWPVTQPKKEQVHHV